MLLKTTNLNIVGFHRNAPQFLKCNMYDINMKALSKAFKVFKGCIGQDVSADDEALNFYIRNHVIAMILSGKSNYDELSEDEDLLFQNYHSYMNVALSRMFYYVLIICIRESRHLHNKPDLQSYIVSKTSIPAYDFLCSIPDDPTTAMNMLKNNPPDIKLGDCVESMTLAFYKGDWSSAYGGKAWGDISKCLGSFVKGETTGEMFMDTAFTLAHNTGPIFNKGMLYQEQTSAIYKILDVQNAGQIPEYIKQYGGGNDFNGGMFVDYYVDQNYTKDSIIEVDWEAVEKAGSKQKYTKQKKKQKVKPKKKVIKGFDIKGSIKMPVGGDVEVMEKKRKP